MLQQQFITFTPFTQELVESLSRGISTDYLIQTTNNGIVTVYLSENNDIFCDRDWIYKFSEVIGIALVPKNKPLETEAPA